jgi:hypothetical protein
MTMGSLRIAMQLNVSSHAWEALNPALRLGNRRGLRL